MYGMIKGLNIIFIRVFGDTCGKNMKLIKIIDMSISYRS